MRFVSIASGSSGNCIYTGTEESHVLIDAGISAKRIEQGLNEVGLKTSELDGICITHDHSLRENMKFRSTPQKGHSTRSGRSKASANTRRSCCTRSCRTPNFPSGI